MLTNWLKEHITLGITSKLQGTLYFYSTFHTTGIDSVCLNIPRNILFNFLRMQYLTWRRCDARHTPSTASLLPDNLVVWSQLHSHTVPPVETRNRNLLKTSRVFTGGWKCVWWNDCTSEGLILMKKLLRLYETLRTLGHGKRLILSLSL